MIEGNIEPSEQRKRLLFGLLAFAMGGAWVLGGWANSLSGAIILFTLFWFGTLGMFQAKEKT